MLTGVFNGNGARTHRRMHAVTAEESRLKFPLTFAADIIYHHRTIFTVPLVEAASFESERTRRAAAAIEASGAAVRVKGGRVRILRRTPGSLAIED